MNIYVEMMKEAKCNDEAMSILRKIKSDIKDKNEMKNIMEETEKYYFDNLDNICTSDEIESVKEFAGHYLATTSMCNYCEDEVL